MVRPEVSGPWQISPPPTVVTRLSVRLRVLIGLVFCPSARDFCNKRDLVFSGVQPSGTPKDLDDPCLHEKVHLTKGDTSEFRDMGLTRGSTSPTVGHGQVKYNFCERVDTHHRSFTVSTLVDSLLPGTKITNTLWDPVFFHNCLGSRVTLSVFCVPLESEWGPVC